MTPRQAAYNVLHRVVAEDAYSHIALDAELSRSGLDARDRGLASELVYGVLTWQRSLDRLLDGHVRGKAGTRALDLEVLLALRLGAYQLVFLDRIPDHSAVDESVELVKRTDAARASGLVNAVLRSLTRTDHPRWWRDADRDRKPVRWLGERWSQSNWIANRLIQMHGLDRAAEVAEGYTRRPPLYLREVGAGFEGPLPEGVHHVDDIPRAFRAESMDDSVRANLESGRWIVQDLGSQLIGWYAGVSAGMRVLDACAGLGGKTVALADVVGDDGHVVALDPLGSKLDILRDSIVTLGVDERVSTKKGELQAYAAETDKRFDLVLVDAPCSGLGTMRRHPETRWRRSEADVRDLAKLQAELLDAAAELVDEGGTLTYSVCTFIPEEGPKQVERFLERHPEFERVDPPDHGLAASVDWARYCDEAGQLDLTPYDHDTDGFYAGRLRRRGE